MWLGQDHGTVPRWEEDASGTSLSRRCQVLVFPTQRTKGQAIEFCVAHGDGGAKIDRNTALQTRVCQEAYDKTHLSKISCSVPRSGQVWSCGSFWSIIFCSFSPSVGWGTQLAYVPWAMDPVTYCFLLPVTTTSESHSVQSWQNLKSRNLCQNSYSPGNLCLNPQFLFYLKNSKVRNQQTK